MKNPPFVDWRRLDEGPTRKALLAAIYQNLHWRVCLELKYQCIVQFREQTIYAWGMDILRKVTKFRMALTSWKVGLSDLIVWSYDGCIVNETAAFTARA